MPSIESLRARRADQSLKLEPVFFAKGKDLAARWSIDAEAVTRIAREKLPYLEFGKSNTRRYDPRDVESYEEREKGLS